MVTYAKISPQNGEPQRYSWGTQKKKKNYVSGHDQFGQDQLKVNGQNLSIKSNILDDFSSQGQLHQGHLRLLNTGSVANTYPSVIIHAFSMSKSVEIEDNMFFTQHLPVLITLQIIFQVKSAEEDWCP